MKKVKFEIMSENRVTKIKNRLFHHGWDHPIHWKALIARLIIFAAALTLIIFLGYLWGHNIPLIESYIKHLGVWGPVIFILLFIVLEVLFLPNASLALIAGALFGIWKGTIIIVIAGFAAELILFTLGRKLFRARAEKSLEKHPKLKAFRTVVTEQPIKLMILLRLSPLPFTPICYMLSMTRVTYRDYIIGYLGFIPGNFVTVYFGFVASHMAKVAANVDDLSPPKLIIAIVGLVASVVLVTYISRAAKKAISEAERGSLPLILTFT